MKLGSTVEILIDVRDNFGDIHSAGELAKVVAHAKRDETEIVQIEFRNVCVFKRGRATVDISKVKLYE